MVPSQKPSAKPSKKFTTKKPKAKYSQSLSAWRDKLERALHVLMWVVAFIVVLGGSYIYWYWNHPLDPGNESYLIKSGSSLRAFAKLLEERGVLPEAHSFIFLGYSTGRSRNLKAGEYRFRSGLTANELLNQVVAGRVVEYPLMLVEGWTFRQFMRALEDAPKLEKTLTNLTSQQIMTRLGYSDLHPEGRFYPDTYYYSNGHTDLMVLTRAFEKMRVELEKMWANRSSDLPLKTEDEALILASIIEKETGREEERRIIAGVFVNRLNKGMRLQSDPTVIYGLGPSFDGNIRLKDLRRDTPYNTYTRGGLPPTPIAMPGGASLSAALNPADTSAIYFVSQGNGEHIFSATLDEHNAAVRKYQSGKKSRATVESIPGSVPEMKRNH